MTEHQRVEEILAVATDLKRLTRLKRALKPEEQNQRERMILYLHELTTALCGPLLEV